MMLNKSQEAIRRTRGRYVKCGLKVVEGSFSCGILCISNDNLTKVYFKKKRNSFRTRIRTL